METSYKLQMDVRNNAEDLQKYVLDLHNWENDMKKKEMDLDKTNFNPSNHNIPPPRNKKKQITAENKKTRENTTKKISGYDYSAWDKYDVDKACEELDKEENGEDTDTEENEISTEKILCDKKDVENKQDDFSLIDEAHFEKELGNEFVRKQDWNSAIKCYTKAINLESRNPIYYANRSLCFFKLKNFKSAEVDATVAIQLDKEYVKAYQRRGYSRLALGQFKEARADFEEIIKIEPQNSSAKQEIKKIDDALEKESKKCQNKPVNKKQIFNHKDIFKLENKTVSKDNNNIKKNEPVKLNPSKTDSKISTLNEVKTSKPKTIVSNKKKEEKDPVKISDHLNIGDGDKKIQSEDHKSYNIFKKLPKHCHEIDPIKIPPHKRSKKPLKRINIVEVDQDVEDILELKNKDTSNVEEKVKSNNLVSEKIKPQEIINPEKYDSDSQTDSVLLNDPKTSIQFQDGWRIVKKNPDKAYEYLKKISGKNLPTIFQHSLESSFFSELVTFLTGDVMMKDLDLVYSYLQGLAEVKRFTSLILFMTEKERESLRKCFSELKKAKPESDVSHLQNLYEV